MSDCDAYTTELAVPALLKNFAKFARLPPMSPRIHNRTIYTRTCRADRLKDHHVIQSVQRQLRLILPQCLDRMSACIALETQLRSIARQQRSSNRARVHAPTESERERFNIEFPSTPLKRPSLHCQARTRTRCAAICISNL